MIRRLALPLIVILAVAATFFYLRWQKQHTADIRERCARATAEIWLATADFREDPQQFLTYRDSVLGTYGLTADEVQEYTQQDTDEPERYSAFVSRVNDLVDSFVTIRVRRARAEAADSADSAELCDSAIAVDTAEEDI